MRDTFPALADRPLTVLHPSINCEFFDHASKQLEMEGKEKEIEEELGTDILDLLADSSTIAFLSINRFERKKNIELAIRAFGWFFLLILNFFNFRLSSEEVRIT